MPASFTAPGEFASALRLLPADLAERAREARYLRPRRDDGPPTLVRLAGRVSARPGIRFEHVTGHSGHLLNEAAGAPASIARRRGEDGGARVRRRSGAAEGRPVIRARILRAAAWYCALLALLALLGPAAGWWSA